MPYYSKQSKDNLDTCHPLLRDLFNEVIKHRDCSIVCGYRGEKVQNLYYEQGKSKLKFPDSKHNRWLSQAVDAVPYPIDWEDIKGFHEFAGFVLGVASQMGIKIRWGGHFKTFFDAPHFELIGYEQGDT